MRFGEMVEGGCLELARSQGARQDCVGTAPHLTVPSPQPSCTPFPELAMLPPRLLGTLLWRGEGAADEGWATHTAESPWVGEPPQEEPVGAAPDSSPHAGLLGAWPAPDE